MPNYTTVSYLLRRLPLLSSMTTVTSADMAFAIEDAEALVNARLVSGGYAVPVAGNPPLLRRIATDLTLYDLLSKRIFTQEQINKSEWIDRFSESNSLLAQIQDGELTMTTASGDAIDMQTAGWLLETNTQNLTPTFNERRPESQFIDPEKYRW